MRKLVATASVQTQNKRAIPASARNAAGASRTAPRNAIVSGNSGSSPFTTAPLTASSEEGQLALDVYQTPTEIVVMAPIAGVKLSDLNVTMTEDVLTIKGNRYLEFDIPEQDYLTQECFWGDFSRSIVLPASVDSTKINASFKDGVLKVSIPRTEPTKTKIIRIKTDL